MEAYMPKNESSFLWTAVGVAQLAAFFAGLSFSTDVHGGFLIGLSFVGVSTFAAVVTQLVSD